MMGQGHTGAGAPRPPPSEAAFSFSGAVAARRPTTAQTNQSINQPKPTNNQEVTTMAFFNSAIGVLQTLVIALGAGLGIWGVINLLEGYGQDNPASKSQGMKQLMAGGGVALIGLILVPLLSGLFG
jgi:hypothetical protein